MSKKISFFIILVCTVGLFAKNGDMRRKAKVLKVEDRGVERKLTSEDKVGGLALRSIVDAIKDAKPAGVPAEIMGELAKDMLDYNRLSKLFSKNLNSAWFSSVRDHLQMKRTMTVGIRNMDMITQNVRMTTDIRDDVAVLKEAFGAMNRKMDQLLKFMNDFMSVVSSEAERNLAPAGEPGA